MRSVMHSLLVTALLATPFATVPAQESPGDDIRKLDDEVQDVKTEVLDIAAELDRLERQLLYPAETRLTVSLALVPREGVQLSAVEVHIDGNLVAHHVYSAGESAALRKGGVQTLHRGNITLGKHELAVSAIGELANGADFVRTRRFAFTKGVDAKVLDITLDPAQPEVDGIRIEDR